MAAVDRFFFLAALLFCGAAKAADCPPPPCFPKPPNLIVGFPAGGTADILARLTAQRLTEVFGQPFIVQNRPGAAGSIAADAVAKSHDENTILVAPTTVLSLNDKLFSRLPYEPRDLVPVTLIASVPQVLVVHSSVNASSVRELVGLAKERPGHITFGSAGNGSLSHLAGEQFRQSTGTRLVHVPYKGIAPAATDLQGGRIQMLFMDIAQARPLLQQSVVKAIAITSPQRFPTLPQVPTMQEAGIAGYTAEATYAMFMARGTDQRIVNRLSGEVRRIVQSPDFRERLSQMASTPLGSSPDETARFIQRESARYAQLVRESGIRPE